MLPVTKTNLFGTWCEASSASTGAGVVDPSGDLQLPIGTAILTGASAVTANIPFIGTSMTALALVQLSASGTATITIDSTSNGTTPTFTSSNAMSSTVYGGERTYVYLNTASATQTNVNGVITTTGVQNTVAIRIFNNSGSTLSIKELRLCSLIAYADRSQWYDTSTADLENGAPGGSLYNSPPLTTGPVTFNT